MFMFIRKNLIPILAISFISVLLSFGIQSVNRQISPQDTDCAEYQDSIYILNYEISQLEIEIATLSLILDEIEEVR